MIFLGLGALGAVAVVALDIGLISAARRGVVDAIQFGQRWNWWDAVAWLLLVGGGVLGLLLLGIGIARSGKALRRPAASLAGSAVLIALFPPLGLACLAVVFVWLAVAIRAEAGRRAGLEKEPDVLFGSAGEGGQAARS